MNREHKLPSPVGVGVITIITILLVLSLTIFSALTLSAAQADYNLSRINADTVSAYYAADREAVRLYTQFAAGTEPELEATIPISETQALHLRLIRDGVVTIDAWTVVSTQVPGLEEDFLPVWGGDPLDPAGE